MNILRATLDDIETLFEIRTSVVQNHQSRAEIAQLGITPESVAKTLSTSESDLTLFLASVNPD